MVKFVARSGFWFLSIVSPQNIYSVLITWVLRAALVLALFSAGWLVYEKLPRDAGNPGESPAETTLQLVLRPTPARVGMALDIPIELYPVDIVAVRHEYFAERRAGKRFDDFLNERMKGRTPINLRLNHEGESLVAVRPGNWWVHAVLSGEENLEWRLPINVAGPKQTVELNSRNAYTRTKSF